MKKALAPALLLSVAILAPATAGADEPLLVSEKRMSLETALRIAQGAIDACREKGIQIGVTVVDRAGNPQVMLRDVLATELTERISRLRHTLPFPSMPRPKRYATVPLLRWFR